MAHRARAQLRDGHIWMRLASDEDAGTDVRPASLFQERLQELARLGKLPASSSLAIAHPECAVTKLRAGSMPHPGRWRR